MLPLYQNIIHLSRYARQDPKTKRRETWEETTERYLSFMASHLERNHKVKISDMNLDCARHSMLNMEALPSMRALMAAGPMLEREHLTGYNCSYLPIDHPRAFDEMLYLLMCTCGVGFSVERQLTGQLPMVPKRLVSDPNAYIVVPDTRAGWARSYGRLIKYLWDGLIPTWDVSKVRPAGAALKTTGGVASGPEPLVRLFKFTIDKFEEAKGRRLSSLDCHDIACHIGDIVMVGGVRQAALISLSNPSDQRLRFAKSGDWSRIAPWRAMANNSAAYTEMPSAGMHMGEWLSLYDSKSGERGIFNRVAAVEKCTSIGRAVKWEDGEDIEFGTNPCGEIVLRPNQMCNLSEVIARHGDTAEDLMRKVEDATMFGTWQSTLTRFGHVRKKWRKNCEEERLLGVSITGIMDCELLRETGSHLEDLLAQLRVKAHQVNRYWADILGINRSAAITTVKPSGTVSQLVDASSGIHARPAAFYIRRINMNKDDPRTRFMIASGLPHEASYYRPEKVMVFSFPRKAPPGAVIEGDRSAIQTLEHWLTFRRHWTDHNPSTTVTVSEKEWPAVGGWVYDHFNELGGVAFMPQLGGNYTQLPNETITEAQWKELEAQMPAEIDWSELADFERAVKDPVQPQSPEFACTAGGCEVQSL